MTAAPERDTLRATPRRLVHVVFHLDVGGVEVGVLNLVQGLAEMGYEQAVCCLERPGVLSTRIPETVALWVCGSNRAQRYLPLLRAAAHLRRFQPDIVHVRNSGAWINAVAAWLLAGFPGKLVFSIHGQMLPRPVDWRAALRCRLLARVTSGLAAVSTITARHFAIDTGIVARPIVILQSGVSTQRFQPRSTKVTPAWPDAPIVLGCVARLDPSKGHDTLLHAFAACRLHSPLKLELHLVGDGPYRERLQALALALGVDASVKFLGECADVARQLEQFDIFILASRSEGRPTSIMEAMSAGLPVVATRVGAIPDMVCHGRSGILVKPADSTALMEALLKLLRDTPMRMAMGACGRQLALEQFSIDDMFKRYDAFYTSLCDMK